jgi:hypothetical protein
MEPPLPSRGEEDRSRLAFTHQRTVFAVSTGMVGVCLTAISLILVVEKLSALRTLSRIVLGCDSLVFLTAALTSFIAMRSFVHGRTSRLHWVADATMLVGLVLAVVVCFALVFTIA